MSITEIYKDYKRTIQCTTLLKLTLALPSSTVTVQSLETNIFCLLLRYISHILRLQLTLLKLTHALPSSRKTKQRQETNNNKQQIRYISHILRLQLKLLKRLLSIY